MRGLIRDVGESGSDVSKLFTIEIQHVRGECQAIVCVWCFILANESWRQAQIFLLFLDCFFAWLSLRGMLKKWIVLLALTSVGLLAQRADVITYLTDGAPSDQDDTKSASSSNPRFSADGKRLVFITQADNFSGAHSKVHYYQIAELDVATGQATYIAEGDYYQSEPAYSPDGNRIVFRTESQNFGPLKNKLDKTGKRTSQIAEWDRSTGKVTYLTDGDFWSDFPEYSPDGNRVVFQTRSAGFSGKFSARKNEWGDPEQQIAEWDRKTGKVTYLTDGDGESSRPQYSPDGKKIVFATGALNLSGEPPARRYQIAELDVASGKFKYLTNGESSSKNPVYSPDGKRIAFETSANFDGGNYSGKDQIAELDLIAGKISYITNGDDQSVSPAYSPDGKLIAFVTRAGNFEGAHTERKDEYGNVAQIAEWSRTTGKVRYLTDGDKPSLWPRYSRKGFIAFQTQADNFAGVHQPRIEYDMVKNEIPVFQLAIIKR